MATTINEPMNEPTGPARAGGGYEDDSRSNPTLLDRAMSRSFVLNWEVALYIAIFALALFTRFYDLGARAMSHDESLHTYYSYELYSEGRFNHTPLMHGPILFHANAFFYSIFGDNDFSARLYPAILGIFMVMSPLLFRRWLGKWGTILACVMILFSPLLMYYNRYIRHDTPSIMSSILMGWSILMYLKGPENQRRRAHWLYILAAAMIWNLGSKETSFFYIAIFGLFLLVYWFVRLAQYFYKVPGRPVFNFIALAVVLAGMTALGMYIVLDIIPLENVSAGVAASGWFGDLNARSFLLWTGGVFLFVSAIVIGTMLYVYRGNYSRLPLRQLLILFGIVAILLAGFIIIEELSHVSTPESEAQIDQPVPGENGEVAVATGTFSRGPLIVAWIFMVVILGGLFISRQAGWWKHLDHFPELDLMIVMGALILPWLTAVFIVGAGGSADEYIAIGNGLPTFLNDLVMRAAPVTGPEQIGRFVVGFLAWLPLMVTAIATGLTWNWRRFLIAFLVFHAIFAFFFTTIFTNIAGLATGMVYSLQYWLEQQGERRGNQPQYYYLLIIMPMYEYLPIIGSVLATVAGMMVFWRRRLLLQQAQEVVNSNVLLEAGEYSAEGSYPLAGDRVMTADSSVEVVDNPTREELAEKRKKRKNDAIEGGLLTADTTDARGFTMSVGEARAVLAEHHPLTEPPFLLFFAWWAIFYLIGLTLAGEKMPWLGTHLTTPMIFLTAWFFGSVFDRINWRTFTERGWLYLLVLPFLVVGIAQVILQPLGGRAPFAGTTIENIQWTNGWLLALAVAVGAGILAVRWIQQTGWRHARQMLTVAVFILLAGLTLRAAWMASFINYDYANEYLVYAHGTNSTKVVADRLAELSFATTNGNNIRYAYDNKMSWPGVWYFRHFDNKAYMGENPTLQQMEDAVVVMVGENNRSVVEPLLEDRYQRFEYSRMWWPMMDYFDLTPQRINDTFYLNPTSDSPEELQKAQQAAQVRRGLFDIWWNRDYTEYGEALGKTYDLAAWPVQDKMYMYVRKDIAAQVWQYGVGDGSVTNPIDVAEASPCIANWQTIPASLEMDVASSGLRVPIGMAVSPDGILYVADDLESTSGLYRFDTETGAFIDRFGQQGNSGQTGAFFNRPNSVAFGPGGTLVVADTWNHMIRTFSPELEPIASWGQWQSFGFNAPQEPTDAFWAQRDVAVDANTADGTFLRDIASGGSAPGQIDEPTGVEVSTDGRVFVADTWNRRVAIFDTQGTFITNWPVNAWYEVGGSRPYLALDEARDILYITDPDGGRVLVYRLSTGECAGAFGQPNRENPSSSEFSTVNGIAVDSAGNVYVSDATSNRVLKFPPFSLPEAVIEVPLATQEILPESSAELQGLPTQEVLESFDLTLEIESDATEELDATAEVDIPEEELQTLVTNEVAATEESAQP
jgi:predicted membrane-bound mannosyltransferase/DNA-binding beta-propeller fold protein YncE